MISASVNKFELLSTRALERIPYLQYFLFGLLLPFGFAPFHLPGLALLGLALFYHQLNNKKETSPFLSGLFFGLGFFGFGTSWVYVSIHNYGHLNTITSGLLTFLFLLYLSCFPALVASLFRRFVFKPYTIGASLLFSALWLIGEYLRATFLSGFPWLLIGFGQIDAPTRFFLPILGVFGVSFISCFAATLISNTINKKDSIYRYNYLFLFITLLASPILLKNISWAHIDDKQPVSVGVIQANLSMRDKWDEGLFWQLLDRYQQAAKSLLGTDVIVMPESAIPLPATYISEFLEDLDEKAKEKGSAILLGIPQPTTIDQNTFFNALTSLGAAKGTYLKQHLVPFGEYIPSTFQLITSWLGIEDPNMKPGFTNQSLIQVHNYPIATLICYEIAYGNLLREQLPDAKWIVSISDDGWFGHSFALYQHLQMAQVRSMQTARYQISSNNDGLSAVINSQGKIENSLPAFRDGILKATVFPASGKTPWVILGDAPMLVFSLLIFLFFTTYQLLFVKLSNQTIAAKHKRRYPYQPS
ncbi:apolipoprotein N-acyltransferase [Legionella gresilensis]|uniref:apolipoprotein N-acyltransferase n=1 Tax=Legionella gresilensis TaxID=91823 RepID=UPI00104113FC|nr:apolipoprotein N-acyltransferase [Legionella gresilensis]